MLFEIITTLPSAVFPLSDSTIVHSICLAPLIASAIELAVTLNHYDNDTKYHIFYTFTFSLNTNFSPYSWQAQILLYLEY
jgi:hypothetical protein